MPSVAQSGGEVLTAESAAAGLEVLEREAVDAVISDMRMPEMTGAEFLEQVFLRWPNVKRILLTGYSDVNSTIAAVNKGKIWRYIAKPWELSVVNDFDALQLGLTTAHRFNRIEALHYQAENRGKRYDPSVVDAFSAVLAEAEPSEFVEMPLRPISLHPGQRLARDLLHHEGYLLLAKDHVLTAAEIEQLIRLETSEGHPLTLYIAQ